LSLGDAGDMQGPAADTPQSVLEKQPGQDGSVARKRLQQRRYSIDPAVDRAELKKLFFNLTLLKARRPA
jgi:hypothetical protein